MRQHGIVHPEMLERMRPNFYPSLCTIGVGTIVDDPFGQPVYTFADLEGHVDIPCRISPRGARETRNAEQIYATATHHVALNGYYPDIDEIHQADIDGTVYDIEGVEHDGNQKTTRLYVRLVDG